MDKTFLTIAATLMTAITANAATPVHNRVLEYVPAPGQFVNTLPEWVDGDDATTMAEKAYNYMVPDGSMISLG